MPLKKELEDQITRQAATIARQTDMLREKDQHYADLKSVAMQLKEDNRIREDALREECMEALMDRDSQLLNRDETIRTLDDSRAMLQRQVKLKSERIEDLTQKLVDENQDVLRLRAKVGYAGQYVGSLEASARAFAAMLNQESS